MRSVLPRVLLAGLVLVALAACGSPSAAPTQATVASQATATTAAPVATQAPAATNTTAPTATTPPTATVAPTVKAAATATTAPTATAAAKTAEDAPQGQGALDLLSEASKAQMAQKAFRVTLNTTDADGKESEVMLEYVKPNSFHMVTAGQEFIIVDAGTFIKQGDAQWEKSPVNMQGMMTEILSQQGIEEMLKNVKYTDVKLVGADMIGGKPMWVYQYKSTMDVGGTKVAAESKNWIGALDKLPYRVEAVSDAGSGAKSTVVGVYEYDESIKIEAPKIAG